MAKGPKSRTHRHRTLLQFTRLLTRLGHHRVLFHLTNFGGMSCYLPGILTILEVYLRRSFVCLKLQLTFRVSDPHPPHPRAGPKGTNAHSSNQLRTQNTYQSLVLQQDWSSTNFNRDVRGNDPSSRNAQGIRLVPVSELRMSYLFIPGTVHDY